MMRSTFRRNIPVALALLLALAGAPDRAMAQADYPSRPITFLVGFAAGGYADSLARLVAAKMSERTGQNIIVENRGGAGGNIAAAEVTKAQPDGYTVLVTTTGLAFTELVSKTKAFSIEDLKAVSIPVSAPETLSVHPKNPANTLAEFIANARGKTINVANPGAGTASQIASSYFFKVLAKIDIVEVPFQGGAPAVNAVAGGHVEALTGSVPGYAGQLQSGVIRGLAIASEKRLSQFPNIPTYGEGGFPGFLASTWVGLFVPAKTSDAIAMKLNKMVDDIIRSPDVQEKFKTLVMEPRYGSQPETAAYFRSEIDTWRKMIAAVAPKAN